MPAPTGVKSNMPKGWPRISSRMRDTMMFGEVPTSVMVPPSSAPNDIGISSDEGEVPVRRASWKAIGISMASAPIFLTKAESTVTAVDQGNDLLVDGDEARAELAHDALDHAGARHGGADHERGCRR